MRTWNTSQFRVLLSTVFVRVGAVVLTCVLLITTVLPTHLTAHAKSNQPTHVQIMLQADQSSDNPSGGHSDFLSCSVSMTCQIQIGTDAAMSIAPAIQSRQIFQYEEDFADRREVPQPHPPKTSA